MNDERISQPQPPQDAKEYEPPVIEEVVSREGLDREVAYAGTTSHAAP